MGLASIIVGAWRSAQADVRRAEKRSASAALYDARWNKLHEIRKDVTERFLKPLVSRGITEGEAQKLNLDLQEMNGRAEQTLLIAQNMNAFTPGQLTSYATSIKRLALRSIKLCQKYRVYDEILTVEYLTYNKTLMLNGTKLYCFD